MMMVMMMMMMMMMIEKVMMKTRKMKNPSSFVYHLVACDD
jgi:hypothetical protein